MKEYLMVKPQKVYKTLPDGTEIVEYEDSLAQAVADMWNKSGEGWGGSFDTGVYTSERVIAKRASGVFYNVYIAMKDGEAIGYCSFNRYYKDADTGYVHLLNVRPDYHGKGLGKELVLMCVNETIARGLPRLDIHTWPGNTKAVPMYKKCGYFWEDRADTTHLSNFIPTVLSTEPIKDYFKTADWYADSTRKIDIKPDGKKVNKFELYEYEWEKDGAHLRVGFEKTGRRINLIETDDYRVEMTAKHHELAFGLTYPCSFHVKNKTGKNLNVSITAKNNDVISFEGSWSGDVIDETTFNGTFFVNPITEAQDDMRMHPCVLADVCINGKTAEFGLGIEPKFPVTVSLGRNKRVAKSGVNEDVYINIKNGLSSDSTVKFTLPQNPLLKFDQSEFNVRLSGGKDSSIKTIAQVLDCGYSGLPITCALTLDDGETIELTRPLHIVNQGITGQFRFETEEFYGAANGLWRLKHNKKNNEVVFERLIESGYAVFSVSQLGKPYDDEFNIMKPADVRVIQDGAFIRFEADFVSGKFTGAVLTEIHEFDSCGTLNRRHKVTNIGNKEIDLSLMAQFWTNAGKKAVYPYDGGIYEVSDKMNFGYDTLDKSKIDENWIFDSNDRCPTGVYWSPQYKPDFRWGDLLVFEFSTGALSSGQSYETDSVVYMCDVFKNYMDFRNFVLGINEDRIPLLHNHLEVITNNGNPVLSAETLELKVKNNRQNIWGGTVSVSSPDGVFGKETQENSDDEIREENSFRVPVNPGSTGLGLADYSMHLSGYEINTRRALMITGDLKIMTKEEDGVFTVDNGKVCFKVSPGNSDAAYSLKYGNNEWFFSTFPSLDPYAWWNPFVGGIKTNLQRFGNSLVLREKITAAFTSETDCFGNVWCGVRADVFVEKFDEYKGMRYSQYYLTLPGVPVLCHYTRLENGSGRFFEVEPYSMIMLAGKDTLSDLCAEMTEGSVGCKVRPGDVDEEYAYDRLVKLTREGENPRPEKLYVYKDSVRDNGKHCIGMDDNIVYCDFNMKKHVPNGDSYTTLPIFCILSEKDLTLESLDDFRRISF